jgi:hypothetical protein
MLWLVLLDFFDDSGCLLGILPLVPPNFLEIFFLDILLPCGFWYISLACLGTCLQDDL